MAHITIKIDTDTGAVQVDDPNGNPIPGQPVDPSKPLPIAGKIDYMNTIVYFKKNPTCVWIGTTLYCY